MNRRQRKWVVLATAVAISVISADLSEAQQRQGRRGFRGFSFSIAALADLAQVQTELKMNDEQKEKASQINEKLAADRRELVQSARDSGGGFGEFREEMTKLSTQANKGVLAILDDAQKKRINEIYVSTNRTRALRDETIAKKLNITPEQQEKMAEVRRSNRGGFGRDLSRQERVAARAEREKKILSVLTQEQRDAFAKLKGEPFELDFSQIARRRGFGGRRGQNN